MTGWLKNVELKIVALRHPHLKPAAQAFAEENFEEVDEHFVRAVEAFCQGSDKFGALMTRSGPFASLYDRAQRIAKKDKKLDPRKPRSYQDSVRLLEEKRWLLRLRDDCSFTLAALLPPARDLLFFMRQIAGLQAAADKKQKDLNPYKQDLLRQHALGRTALVAQVLRLSYAFDRHATAAMKETAQGVYKGFVDAACECAQKRVAHKNTWPVTKDMIGRLKDLEAAPFPFDRERLHQTLVALALEAPLDGQKEVRCLMTHIAAQGKEHGKARRRAMSALKAWPNCFHVRATLGENGA